MPEHPYHDMAEEVLRYFTDNPRDPELPSHPPLTLYIATRSVLKRYVHSSEQALILFWNAVQCNAPLQLPGERIELDGTDLFEGFFDMLAHSIEAYLVDRYDGIGEVDKVRRTH